MRRFSLFFFLAAMAAGPGALDAQTIEGGDALEARDAITRMIEQLQGRVVGLQWRLLDETESLVEALERPRVDQDRAMDRLETVLDTEKEIKQVHLELLIRIKNVLTPEQQERLDQLRADGPGEQT